MTIFNYYGQNETFFYKNSLVSPSTFHRNGNNSTNLGPIGLIYALKSSHVLPKHNNSNIGHIWGIYV